MSNLPSRLKALRTNAGLTQEEFGKIFGLVKSTVSLYESGKSTPNDEIKMQICKHFNVSIDYLLGLDGDISADDVFGYDGGDENAITFRQKFIHQISLSGKGLHDLSVFLEVSEDTLMDWLSSDGKDTSYSYYYKKLSEFYGVNERYWVSPRAISPGIEPDMDEYLLILMRRDYMESGKLNPVYGSLESYFPGLKVVSSKAESSLLSDYRQMNQDSRDIIKGKIKEVLRTQRYDDAAVSNSSLSKVSGK